MKDTACLTPLRRSAKTCGVLPGEFARVPEEQILQAARRLRRLYEGRPLAGILNETGRRVFARSFHDLDHTAEARELGMAVFLDRPLGVAKQRGEVDRTPLLSYDAFSRSIAARRLAQARAADWIDEQAHQRFLEALDDMPLLGRAPRRTGARGALGRGIAGRRGEGGRRFQDPAHHARLIDFLSRTVRSERPEKGRALWPEWLEIDRHILFASHSPADRSPVESTLRLYDCQGVLRLELGFETTPGRFVRYRERGGVELAERLRVLVVGQCDTAPEQVAFEQPVWLRLR